MSGLYDSPVKSFFEKRTRLKFDKSIDITELILDASAERELSESIEVLNDTIKDALGSFANTHLKPKMQFTHVKEAGFRIWGGRDNLAMSKFTMSHLLHELCAVCGVEKRDEALAVAGCKSAFQFFDDFFTIVTEGNKLLLPENELEFLWILTEFDYWSSFWTARPTFVEEESFISITLQHPFTTFPWVDNDSHTFNSFLCAYLRTLYNCAADLHRVISFALNRVHKSKFAIEVVDMEQMDPKRVYLRIYLTDKYIEQYNEIDRIFVYVLQNYFRNPDNRNIDLAEFQQHYKVLVTALRSVFGDRIHFKEDIRVEILNRKNSEFHNHVGEPASIIIELRDLYQRLRTEELTKLDYELLKEIEHAKKPVT